MEEGLCPCCGRHCSLKAPHCGRGEEYLRTGIIPEKSHGKEAGGKTYEKQHDRPGSRSGINNELIIRLRELGHMIRFQNEGKAGQKRTLIILNEAQCITQHELTERLGIQPGSVSELLAKLESSGLIMRTQNNQDRRTADIQLTDTGRELAREAARERAERQEAMFRCLTEKEKQELLGLLEKVSVDWDSRFREEKNARGHDGYQKEKGRHNRHYAIDGHGKPDREGKDFSYRKDT